MIFHILLINVLQLQTNGQKPWFAPNTAEFNAVYRQKHSLSTTMIKNIHFLFSSYFENISTPYLPCKVSSQNSHGKCHYFNFTFQICLSAITQFKNDWDQTVRVGSSWPKDEVM